jgi:hypothetical protein
MLIRSEDPLHEVWDHIARYGTSFPEKHLRPDKLDIPWDEHLRYAQIRTRQALEFRHAARDASLLTAPLPLYYSFLNLTRAFLAIGPEVMPQSRHGLKFVSTDDLMNSYAQIEKSGTFVDYLDSLGFASNVGAKISLVDALGSIVELTPTFGQFDAVHTHVQTVSVRGLMTGPVRLHLLNYPRDWANWQSDFPELVESCAEESVGVLLLNDRTIGQDYLAVCKFLSQRLLPGLTLQNHPTWYAIRKGNGVLPLPRAAYYFVAMFILGSAVRYQPELLLAPSTQDSEIGWLLGRFIRRAERYFPQLKLMELHRSQLYFSGDGGL